LNLKCVELVSSFAFNFNMRPHIKADASESTYVKLSYVVAILAVGVGVGRGLHSSTFRLDVCTISGVLLLISMTKTVQVEM
jgi:hypothetical protein